MENWREMEPTEKQLEFIDAIEKAVGVEFVGTTRGEACEFISDNRDEFKNSQSHNDWALRNGY